MERGRQPHEFLSLGAKGRAPDSNGATRPESPRAEPAAFLLARVVPCGGSGDMATPGDLSDDEKRAMRGSKFAPLPPPPPSSRPQPRMAHPGGPLTTNKAAALAKFLERKLQQPDGLDSLNPDLVNLAVKNAKETIKASKGEPSTSGRVVRHVSSFEDGSEDSEEEAEVKGMKRKRKIKKVKAHQDDEQHCKKKRKKKNKKKKGKDAT